MVSLEQLDRVAEKARAAQKACEVSINVCMAAACQSAQSGPVLEALTNEINKVGLAERCAVRSVGCMGPCAKGPCVAVEPHGVLYGNVKAEDAPALVDSLAGAKVERLAIDTTTPFFTRQTKVVLSNSGRINPEKIEDYIAADGYRALLYALSELTPAEVVQEVTKSGLRGRGGAGYPTGLKWNTVAKAAGTQKYVICNADEGDPGAFMDRAVLESDPHRVLEGMAIAAYAVGADHGYIYVRAEYPLAIERLRSAIRQAQRQGFLGRRVGDTEFNFEVELRLGGGAFVCGEETALIASIEGKRGLPRPRPPFPANYGLFGCPTLINNVETFANIAPILAKGGDWYASIGTEKSKGAKVFALAGQIVNGGLIEVPMGITLREIVFDIGGGLPNGKKFKAVQTGGPSGGCIPEQHLDLPVDYESLRLVGSIMGSGGMIIIDDGQNMVDVARYFMDFCMCESCGKCIPCRVGTAMMQDLLGRFCRREATDRDLNTLRHLCNVVRDASLCGLGQSAPNPVLSTLKYFEHEYRDALLSGPEGNGHAPRQSSVNVALPPKGENFA
jgi:bidirectional [NiFe] hydrogenase diaphorase subunit